MHLHQKRLRKPRGDTLDTPLTSRLASPIRQFGWKEGLIYLLAKGLSLVSAGKMQLIRYHLVAQPVPQTSPERPLPPGARTSIDFLTAEDPIVAQFPRASRIIARRFANGDRCIAARTDNRFTGYIWFARNQYHEDTVRCLYVLAEPTRGVWDYDVYVDPDFRMGRTFSRLWSTANRHLAAEGVRWSYSRIAAANPQSIDSHRRLGIRTLYSANFVRLGSWQLMLAGAPPYIHLSTSPGTAPTLQLRPPAEQPPS